MNQFVVGLTGGVGTGKSTVLKLFQDFGVKTLSADIIAHDLVKPGAPSLLDIQQHFGDSVIQPDGRLNRALLRQIIFDNLEEKKWLEDLLHPLIREAIEKEVKKSKAPYVMIEIPLLYDRTNYPYLNRILLIKSNKALQIQRVSTRDKTTIDEVERIISSQHSDEARENIADDIIDNTGDINTLKKACHDLHLDYQKKRTSLITPS